MNLQGSRVVDAPAEKVFAAICDPGTLMSVIPGCQGIEREGDEYRGEIALRVPGFAGTYRTVVRLTEARPPGHGRIAGEVTGALGSVRGEASFDLTEADARTTVTYAAQATISGPLARLDNRFVEGLAGSLISQGLDDLGARLRRSAGDATGTVADDARPPTDPEETPA